MGFLEKTIPLYTHNIYIYIDLFIFMCIYIFIYVYIYIYMLGPFRDLYQF